MWFVVTVIMIQVIQKRLVVKLGDVIIAQTHGHLYGINFTWDKLDLWRNKRMQIFVSMATCMRQQLGEMVKTVFINPGSVSQPRGPSMRNFMLR